MVWLAVPLFLVALLIAASLFVSWYFRWEAAQTASMAYFGVPLGERRAIKARIRRHAALARPIVRLLAAANGSRAAMPVFEFEGVTGPPGVSNPEVFARAKAYQPQPQDIFVATQMRCGTTWMQQIVFQIVTRGAGELSDAGHGHLYAMSPWIDALNTVSMADAPLVGQPPSRIIKTHLPVELCPYSADAKYVYVTRHPVSCFASIVDYNRSLLGPLMPAVPALADWFCSDRMYWLPWPRHVEGWWRWAEQRSNVLFVHYEEMTRDFPQVLDRLAGFLGCALTPEERQRIVEKCTYKYMKDHEEWFEMAPPTMFSVDGGEYLKGGREQRHEDAPPPIRDRILTYCRQTLAGATYPAARFYPDLAPTGPDGA